MTAKEKLAKAGVVCPADRLCRVCWGRWLAAKKEGLL